MVACPDFPRALPLPGLPQPLLPIRMKQLAGGVVAVLIGFLNPRGIIVVLISSVASCVGGTSGGIVNLGRVLRD